MLVPGYLRDSLPQYRCRTVRYKPRGTDVPRNFFDASNGQNAFVPELAAPTSTRRFGNLAPAWGHIEA
eukprot:212437-Rhodomonas_salina.1